MCGVVGFYNLTRSSLQIDENILDRMQQKIAHRGPDARGLWINQEHELALAARRLSIIDLSDAGNQPMYRQQHQVVVCFNGEIYNHLSLREQLEQAGYVYQSNSDTETIIYAYKHWGIQFLQRLEGMFAIVLFDLEKKNLYLARDRFGVKPLYFSLHGGVLSFASEIKALHELPWMTQRMSAQAFYHYLTFMVAPAPLTIFEGIYKLPAGFYACVDKKKEISFTEWYCPVRALNNDEKSILQSEHACVEHIKNLLVSSVQKRMIADVPVGAFLSGGVDSSLIVALMSQVSSKVKTFTVGFAEDKANQEFVWARIVSHLFGTEHREIEISEREAFNFYENMITALDEPLADCVCIPFYYVSLLARQMGMKVVQVGEGADEIFSGYPLYAQYANINRWAGFFGAMAKPLQPLARLFAQATHKQRPFRAELLFDWGHGRSLFWGGALAFGEQQKKDMFIGALRADIQEDAIVEKIYPGLKQGFDSHVFVDYHAKRLQEKYPQADFGQQMFYLEFKQRLPELLLMRADKMSMATSIEAREPFLDHHLVEFMFHVPLALRMKNNQTKYLLKKVAEQFLIPDIVYRKKVGFAAPTLHWLDKGSLFPGYVAGQGAKKSIVNDKWLGRAGVHDVEKNKNGNHRAVQQWVLLNARTFGKKHELFL